MPSAGTRMRTRVQAARYNIPPNCMPGVPRVRRLRSLILLGALLPLAPATDAGAATPTSTAAPASPQRAQIAVRFDPLRQCPDLRVADPEEQNVAIVVFLVGPTGVPSQPTIKSAASSDGLDTASEDCVLRLRFQPATRWGDGTAVDSWQQIAWKWAPARARQAALGSAAAKGSNAASGPAADAAPDSAAVAVRVCVDAAGKLQGAPSIVRSSGDALFDAAAVQIAQAGSGSYRAGTGAAAAGCLELSIKPAGK